MFKHCMHEYSGDTRDVHMLYHNMIMHVICNSQLNVEQSKPYYTSNKSHILFEFVIMCGVCSLRLNIKQSKQYYISNILTFYLNLW